MPGGGARSDTPSEIFDALDADFDSHLTTIRRYLRQPSVSATGEGIQDAAALTAELVEAAGGTARVIPTDGHPVVLGRVEGAGPALLRYGMYDVQPADEPGWASGPFEAVVREIDGVGPAVVARGSANSKGTLSATLCALKTMRRVADLPATVIFMLDGEEELGSPSLPKVLAEHREELAADAAFDLDLHADRNGVPDVYLGVKGVLSVMLSCRGGEWGGPDGAALHSSSGPIVASPAWALVRALDALVGPGERPRIDLPRPPIPAEDGPLLDGLAAAFSEPSQREVGPTRRFKVDGGREMVEALIYEPFINLNGLAGGAPQGSKTIIPHEVRAALDLRLPYGMDIEATKGAIVAAVGAAAPEVDVDIYETCPPARTSPSSAVARAMIASHSDVGPAARVWPSAPWWAPYYLFQQELGIPYAHGGAGHSGGAHSANEYASIEGLRAHMKQFAAFLYRFASEHTA